MNNSEKPAPISRWDSKQFASTISLVFALLFTQLSFLATAQTSPLKEWDARFGTSIDDYFFSLQQTADGGYILGGRTYSGMSGDKTQASQGGTDYWVVKTDADGTKQWDARFGGNSSDVLYSLQQTADGGYILGGSSSSGISGDKTQESQGDNDYWIVKTDANGVKQWDAGFGGSDYDEFHSLQQTADGGYILGGYSSSAISGDKTQASQGDNDYWIVKTDASGEKLWDARFGGGDDDYLYSLQQTADGGYILGGYSWSGKTGDKTKSSQGGADYWIVKTDANGVKLWDARFGGSSEEKLYSLQQTADGGYILGGASLSGISGDKTQSSQGNRDYWIIKTDANGTKLWDVRFGGSGDDLLYSLEQTADGGYILGGYSYSGISGDKTQASQGSNDYWIVKTDANGIKQWDARFGGNFSDYLNSLEQTADGGYILGGYSNSAISGDKTQASQGYSDYWIVKVASSCSGGVVIYADADGDGYGNANDSLFAADCIVPGGYTLDSTDCNDNPANGGTTIHPGSCDGINGIDDNCSGIVDDGFGTITFYLDADSDGYGNPVSHVNECNQPAGYVINKTDCQDANGLIHPGGEEILNGIDDNCNGINDEGFAPNTWVQKANFGGTGRSGAVGFSIGTKGYIGTGADGSYKKDFWEYNPATDAWTQKADFGGIPRQHAVGFSIGVKGYIGTGGQYLTYYKDFWEYDPATNVWTQKADFGGSARDGAVGFSIGSKGYIGTGDYSKNFWEYDPATDAWTQKEAFGGTGRQNAVGFSIGSKGYIGTGWHNGYQNDFWEYDPTTDAWTQKANFAGIARYGAVGFSIGTKGYLGTGFDNNSFLKDFWEYDLSTNAWSSRVNVGGSGREYAVGFSIGNKGYIGTGYYDDFWEYTPPCIGQILYADTDSDGYGNVADTFLVSDCITPAGYVADHSDCNDSSAIVHPDAAEILNGIDDNCNGIIDEDHDIWLQKTSFGGTARSGAVGFSIGSKGYIGTGNYDFWEYDPATSVWTQKANFGGTDRYYAVGFSIGSKGYLGTGYDGHYKNDFWEYDLATNTWTQKADVGGSVRSGAVGFSIGGKGYIGTGTNDNGYNNNFWEYDPSNDTWTQKANFGGTARNGAVGFSIGSKGYLGTGYDGNYKNDFWEYDPSTNSWTQKADFGGTARGFATGFSIGSKGYIGTGDKGSSNFTKDFWEYDPAANAWTQIADFSGTGRNKAVGFSIGSKGYVGTGFDANYKNDFWEYIPVCFGFTFYADADGDGFGSAGNTYNSSNCVAPDGYVIDSLDCNDNKGTIYPGACDGNNGVDDNCNGIVDEGFGLTTFYLDADNDGYGNPASHVNKCNQPAGYVANNTDCQDANALINPGVAEIPNGIDDNCSGLIDDTGIWIQKTDFGGTARYGAVGFSIGTKVYIGTGTTGYPNYYNDFWEYDPVTDVWTQNANFGGGARAQAVGFSIGSKGYIGTGGMGSYNETKDFWEYNPASNAWKQQKDFKGIERIYAVGFSIGDKGYLGTGSYGSSYIKDFFEYNPASNTWTQKADLAGSARQGACGFSIDTMGYIGTGYEYYYGYRNDFWKYDPATDVWTQDTYFPGAARTYAVGLSVGGKGYVGLGLGHNYSVYNDFYELNVPVFVSSYAYADADSDGYGNANDSLLVVDSILPAGYVYDNNDCNDSNASVHPNAPELCNSTDDNCNGVTDEGCGGTCASPTNLTANSITASTAIVKWNAVAGAEGYKIRYKVSGTNSWTVKHSTRKSKDLHNLSPNITYTWQVKTFCSSNPGVNSDWSAKQHFTTAALRIGDESIQQPSFQIYPNPTDGTFTLDLKLKSEQNIEAIIQVLNMTGQLVYDKTIIVADGVLQKEIQLPDAANGTYLVKVTVSDRVYSGQINYQK